MPARQWACLVGTKCYKKKVIRTKHSCRCQRHLWTGAAIGQNGATAELGYSRHAFYYNRQIQKFRNTESDTNPTNNALLINFLLSSDAEILLLSTDWAYKSAQNVQRRVCNVYILLLSFHFAYHRWWLGSRMCESFLNKRKKNWRVGWFMFPTIHTLCLVGTYLTYFECNNLHHTLENFIIFLL